MLYSTFAVLVAMVVAMKYFIEYRDWLDWNKDFILRNAPGACVTVLKGHIYENLSMSEGPFSHDADHIFQGFAFDGATGSISALDLNSNKVVNINITNVPNRADFLASPHGITTWKDSDTGNLYLYVLTHPRAYDCVEVFRVGGDLLLTHVRTITDQTFTYMNDLVAVGKDQFYITGVWRYREKAYEVIETYLRRPNGRIVYYDGHKGREVASGYFMANGINVSPDMSIIYMSEMGFKTLHAFKRDETNGLRHLWAYNMGTAIDNIDVDPETGDLWIGCHPIMWKIVDFYGMFQYAPSSQVIRVKLRDNMVSEIEEIYADDGMEIAGSTVAVQVNGKLVIGSFLDATVVCDINFLTS